MPFRSLRLTYAVLSILAAVLVHACGGPEKAIEESLRANVLFFSNFEKGVDALDSLGDPLANFDTANTRHIEDGGAANGYLSFGSEAGALNYASRANFPYKANRAWSGSIAFWLKVDVSSFEANYPEPFHIGKKDNTGYPWDDAVIFLDFKKSEKTLRFGCYPNKTQEITDQMVAERVISVPANWRNEWHHIVLTFSNFNSGRNDAEWALFVDGVEKGRKRGLRQDMAWNAADLTMRFNHYKYPGQIDEIAVFEKVLNAADAKYLTAPKKKLSELFYKKGERR